MIPAFTLAGHFKFNDVISAGRAMALARPDLGPADVAVLQYTGGTTGVAKGATLLHHTIVANLLASEVEDAAPASSASSFNRVIHYRLRPAALSRLRLHHLRAAQGAPRSTSSFNCATYVRSRSLASHQHLPRGEHAVQRTDQSARLRQAFTSQQYAVTERSTRLNPVPVARYCRLAPGPGIEHETGRRPGASRQCRAVRARENWRIIWRGATGDQRHQILAQAA